MIKKLFVAIILFSFFISFICVFHNKEVGGRRQNERRRGVRSCNTLSSYPVLLCRRDFCLEGERREDQEGRRRRRGHFLNRQRDGNDLSRARYFDNGGRGGTQEGEGFARAQRTIL